MEAGLTIGAQVSHFRVGAELGRGGMGIVYQAEDLALGRRVALKVLRPAQVEDPDRRARFVREARSAAAVVHPSIAVVYEIFEEAGAIVIAMEWIDGRTLRALIARQPLELDEVLRIASELAAGMACAHAIGIVHRDLKPENVMIARDGQVKILDFGLAKRDASAEPVAGPAPGALITDAGHILGTPEYMSPEQARGQPVDHRSDVFSFGAILYELVAGRRPFLGATRVDVLAAVLSESPPPLAGSEERGGPELARIIDKCLAKDRDDRYQSSADLVVDVRRLRRGALVQRPTVTGSMPPMAPSPRPSAAPADGPVMELAPATSLAPTVVSFTRATGGLSRRGETQPRRRVLRGAVAGTALVGLVGLAVVGMQLRRPRREEAPVVAAPASALASTGPGGSATPRDLNARQVTNNALENQLVGAALSPDGRYLAYVDDVAAWIRPVAAGDARVLRGPAGGKIEHVAWVPDGTQVLMTVVIAGRASIWQSALIGGQPTLLVDDCREAAPSPDGQRLACLRDHALVVIERASLAVRELTRFDAHDRVNVLRWSPDGRHVAYFHARAAQNMARSIDVVNVAEPGHEPHVLVGGSALGIHMGEVAITWLPDGRLLFGRAPERRMSLATLAIDLTSATPVGEPIAVTMPGDDVLTSLTTSADGRRLAFVRINWQTDVFVAALDRVPLVPRRFTLDDHDDRVVDWSADSHELWFYSTRSGELALHRQAIDQPDATLVRAERAHETQAFWHDGTSVVAVHRAQAPDTWAAQVESLGGGPAVTLADDLVGPGPAIRCRRPPARGCVVSETVDGAVVLSRLADDGPRVPVARLPQTFDRDWAMSPSGELIAMVVDKGELRVIRVSDGQVRVLPSVPDCPWQFVSWAADGGSLFATCVGLVEPPYRLYAVALTGSARLLFSTERGWLSMPRPSPDGKWLAFSHMTLDSDVWVADAP